MIHLVTVQQTLQPGGGDKSKWFELVIVTGRECHNETLVSWCWSYAFYLLNTLLVTSYACWWAYMI